MKPTLKKILFSFVFFFSLVPVAKASIIINEVAWMGDRTSYNHEWIELYNDSQEAINLNDWILKTADEKIKINLQGIIPNQGFFLLEKSNDDSVKDIPADLIYQGALNNAGEKIQLFDSQNKLVDEVDNLSGWVYGDNKTKQTLSKVNGEWCTSEAVGGTPKAANQCLTKNPEAALPTTSTPANSPTPTDNQIINDAKNVFINEILPSPEGPDTENEWVEIYNANNFPVDISGWQIKDTVGSIKKYAFVYGSVIPSQGFLILMSPQTKISLQNNGDGFILTNTKNIIVDQVTYPKAPDNQSYNRINYTAVNSPSKNISDWQWSLALTPGKPNIIKNTTPILSKPNEPAPPVGANISQNQNGSLLDSKPQSKPSFNFNLLIGISVALASTTIVLILSKKFPPKP